mmetsp:Transcript_52004/g.103322  ORF Transcript_52004/g.103322 Transcript_52004/m.103322 type:complete len:102 (+) Transcript_52004:619-924(+)
MGDDNFQALDGLNGPVAMPATAELKRKNSWGWMLALTCWQRKHNNYPPQRCSCHLHADQSCGCLPQHHIPKEAAVKLETSKSRAAPALAKEIVAHWGQPIS